MILDTQLLTYGLYFLIAATTILVAEAAFLSFSGRQARRGAVNRRLRQLETDINVESVLATLRKERGLTEGGDYRYPIIFLNRLYLQSGMAGSVAAYFATFLITGLFVAVIVWMASRSELMAFGTFLLAGPGLSLFVLSRKRARRRARFAEQLPEALDIVVRSLKAGHPTPVAITLVAREMSDPIGSEFGIVSDEMTYGLELETAMRNLFERVGLEDLRLIVISIGIQTTTGGNLAEILGNLANVIRERFRMRRKIRAISAEGRWSAILLSIFPLFLFGVINLIAPTYYGDVWDNPLLFPVLGAAFLWVLFGDYIMYRMVNFDF